MNDDWVDFLKSNNTSPLEDLEVFPTDNQGSQKNTITALSHFSILKVSGADAAIFLQGQLTCDIRELNESKSFFSAFCNAKGQVISTLLIIKTPVDFLLILPIELIDKVYQKLQMYIMRSNVQLNNITNEFCLIGINTQAPDTLPLTPETTFDITQNKIITVKFPLHNNRYLIIASLSQAISLWTNLVKASYIFSNPTTWIEHDISAGIPWLSQASTEKYIPQMLNIDKLGGISFNKGCYTGQEIIARTHYLGKAKRELFLAYCDGTAKIDDKTQIMTKNSEQTIGKVLSLKSSKQYTKMLVVMPSADTKLTSLILNNAEQNNINILDFQ